MNNELAVSLFNSLASGIRLEAFRLLVRAGHAGLVAGELATRLDVAPNNLSFHLKALAQAGLVMVEQEGRFQRYRANLPLMVGLVAYLTEECCNGQPDACVPANDADCCR